MKQVVSGLVVCVHAEAQAPLEHRKVQTDIELLRGFPLQVFIGQVVQIDTAQVTGIVEMIAVADGCVVIQGLVGSDRRVADLSPAQTEFERGNDRYHKPGFAADIPRNGGRREPRKTVFRAELGTLLIKTSVKSALSSIIEQVS